MSKLYIGLAIGVVIGVLAILIIGRPTKIIEKPIVTEKIVTIYHNDTIWVRKEVTVYKNKTDSVFINADSMLIYVETVHDTVFVKKEVIHSKIWSYTPYLCYGDGLEGEFAIGYKGWQLKPEYNITHKKMAVGIGKSF